MRTEHKEQKESKHRPVPLIQAMNIEITQHSAELQHSVRLEHQVFSLSVLYSQL